MKRKDIITGKIARVEFPNKGIIETPDGKVIVKNALPGQKVSCAITKARNGKYEARLLEVLEEAGDAVESPCIHFGKCGGCSYLTMPYVKELGLKEQQVRRILNPILEKQKQSYTWEGIKTSPVKFAYRNKMEFTFGDEELGGPLALGMHKRNSMYDIVSVTGCRIVDDDYNHILSATLSFFGEQYKEGKISFYHRMKQVGYLRHLLVRKAVRTGEILIDIVTTTQENHDLSAYSDMLLTLDLKGRIVGILHTINDSKADAVIDEGTSLLYGQDYFYEELLGLRFRITPFSFFQTNSLSAEVLYDTVREYIDGLYHNTNEDPGDKVIYDLYCGTGTIAQIVAPIANRVIGVEIVEEAVLAAKENAARNNLTDCEFIAGDVLKVLDDIETKPDLIILDPPRDGINSKALAKIINYGVDHMIYVSCKPTSLARDLEQLAEGGYYVQRAVAVDQFPWTNHVETVCLLSQRKPDTTIEVDLDISELEVSSAETKATYEEIKSYVLKKFGLKVSNLYIAQIKRECGIVERINYNLPKTEGNRVPQCPEDKRKAIKDAFIHFQMI
ncbi:MAG: 23S rRNA (uracil(1939)-C(5))-methyltransferase RlmD [Butyrivibrio sp.]|nr:23S rRNA (uracil(1939)-C(5))-methyltransferase RlmD [Butyrivibrio sp.]